MVPREPRLAVRRHRKVVVVLAVSIALALSGLGIESASASTRSRLAVSLNSGSVECGAARRFEGQREDLRLREELEDSRQSRLLH